jgi:hypothetical protein
LTREEFHNIVKEYSQIKLYENTEKDRVFMYINDVTFGWYDDKINAVRIINRFIMVDDNYGHLYISTPTVPAINMRKAENFSNKLKDLFKQKKQLEIEIKLIELDEDFTND